MTQLLEKAFSRVRSLSHETQDELARVLLRLAGDQDEVYIVSDEEDADLASAEAEVERGELATDAETETIFAKYRV